MQLSPKMLSGPATSLAMLSALLLCSSPAAAGAPPRRLRGWGLGALTGLKFNELPIPVVTSIESNYDERCDPHQPGFLVNNSHLLDQKANFNEGPATIVGCLNAAWDLAQVAVAYFSVPALPLPTADLWRGMEMEHMTDPQLGIAGPTLGRVIVPPNFSPITANYMNVKMKDPAKLAGIRMPFSVNFAIVVFFAQALQGVYVALKSYLFGPMNVVWLGLHFPLTFRFELWVAQLFLIARLLLSYKAMQRFIGVDVTSALQLRKATWSWLRYPWTMEGRLNSEEAVYYIDVISKRVILPTAALGILIFWTALVCCLAPGLALAVPIRIAWKQRQLLRQLLAPVLREVRRSCEGHLARAGACALEWARREGWESLAKALESAGCRAQPAPAEEPLLGEERLEPEPELPARAQSVTLLPRLEDVREWVMMLLFGVLCGYFVSLAIEERLSPETYLCPFAKMTVLSIDPAEVNSLGGYLGVIVVLVVLAYAGYGLANVYRFFASEQGQAGWKSSGRLSGRLSGTLPFGPLEAMDEVGESVDLGRIGQLIHGLWIDRCFRELDSEEQRDKFRALAFARIADLPEREVPCPDELNARDLLAWAADASHEGQEWKHAKVGAARCLRKAGWSAEQLRGEWSGVQVLAQAGYAAGELSEAGFTLGELRGVGFDAQSLQDLGCGAAAMREAGFTAQQLREVGVDAKGLHDAGYTAKESSKAGYTADELRLAGYDAASLSEIDGLEEMGGFEGFEGLCRDLAGAGFDVREVAASVMKAKELMLQTGRVDLGYVDARTPRVPSAGAPPARAPQPPAAPQAEAPAPGVPGIDPASLMSLIGQLQGLGAQAAHGQGQGQAEAGGREPQATTGPPPGGSQRAGPPDPLSLMSQLQGLGAQAVHEEDHGQDETTTRPPPGGSPCADPPAEASGPEPQMTTGQPETTTGQAPGGSPCADPLAEATEPEPQSTTGQAPGGSPCAEPPAEASGPEPQTTTGQPETTTGQAPGGSPRADPLAEASGPVPQTTTGQAPGGSPPAGPPDLMSLMSQLQGLGAQAVQGHGQDEAGGREPQTTTGPSGGSPPADLPDLMSLMSQFRGPGAQAMREQGQRLAGAGGPEPETQRQSADLAEGRRVRVRGVSAVQFNGLQGTCTRFQAGRWEVALETGDSKRFKPESLEALAEEPTPRAQPAPSRRFVEPREARRCEIQRTAIGSGVAACNGQGRQCRHCRMHFCPYHYEVNMDDGLFSFGGHTCPAFL